MRKHIITLLMIGTICCFTQPCNAQLSGNYDVGGGNNDYTNPVAAAVALQTYGVSGPVTFNIYSGTYDGQIDLPGTIQGLNETNTVTFQNAPGNSPVITSTSGHGFNFTGADYITIQGLTITNCSSHGIYNNYSGADYSDFNTFIGNTISNIQAAGKVGIYLKYASDCQIIGNCIDGCYYGISNYYGTRIMFANNMISNAGYHGIREYYGLDNSFYYNSVYTASPLGTGTRAAFYLGYSTNSTVKDNIFYQGSTGTPTTAKYAIILTPHPCYATVSDYNNLYAPYVNVGLYGLAQNTLTDWRNATGMDGNSISADPNFVSISTPGDLHITEPSPVMSIGTPIPRISDDFDGDSRDPVTPDIGADEVAPPAPPPVEDLIIILSGSTDDSTDITLLWSTVPTAQQYHIYKSSDPYTGFTLVGSTTNTTYTDTNAIIIELTSFYYITADDQPIDGIRTPMRHQ